MENTRRLFKTAVTLVVLVTSLAAFVSASSDDTLSVEPTVLFEQYSNGTVTLNHFDEEPEIKNLIPIVGEINPSRRLRSCDKLQAGHFPVWGNCSEYLECARDTAGGFIRRIVACPQGLWFRHETGDCGPMNRKECPVGRLVAAPMLTQARATLNRQAGQNGGASCSEEGEFPLPGCRGYYTCYPTTWGSGWMTFTYMCAPGYKWSQDERFCMPEEQVTCNVADDGTSCVRECRANEPPRECHFTFIVEEFGSMTYHCKNCPFDQADCNLPSCIAAGGVKKTLTAINRQVPGPAVQACKGDTLIIDVQNRMSADAMTIHWHGLHQKATPHMDGVPYITQCPIHPGMTFRYKMLADISGTHLYHSHLGHQESDGMFGPMIIREPRTDEFGINLRYDEDLPEHRMLIWHWFPRPAETESLDMRMQSRRREGYGITINGKGRVERIFGKDGQPAPTPYETYNVVSNRRYRFRSIFNSALICPAQISIDGHQLDILATDGRPIAAAGLVDSFILSAGERVDFVPHPHWRVNPANQSFLIRVRGLMDCDDNKNGVFQHAFLRYDGSVSKPANSDSNYANSIRSGLSFNTHMDLTNNNNYYIQSRGLHTAVDANKVIDPRISGTPNKTFYIESRFNAYTQVEDLRVVLPQLNGISFSSPSFPPLTQPGDVTDTTFCKPGAPRNCNNQLCKCTQMLEIDNNDLVELVIYDPVGSGFGHPYHLHGFAYRVVAVHQSSQPFTLAEVMANNTNCLINKRYNGPLKDTLMVPRQGYSVVRFVADNPGYWLFHCHFSEHMAEGMALVFKVGQHQQMVKPPSNFPKCGNFF